MIRSHSPTPTTATVVSRGSVSSQGPLSHFRRLSWRSQEKLSESSLALALVRNDEALAQAKRVPVKVGEPPKSEPPFDIFNTLATVIMPWQVPADLLVQKTVAVLQIEFLSCGLPLYKDDHELTCTIKPCSQRCATLAVTLRACFYQ